MIQIPEVALDSSNTKASSIVRCENDSDGDDVSDPEAGAQQKRNYVDNDEHEHDVIQLQESFHDDAPRNTDVLGMAFWSFLGVTTLQACWSVKADSEALWADSIAMFIDAATYLCNMFAERGKSRPISKMEGGKMLSPAAIAYKTRLRILKLELFPPLISVVVLLYLTITTVMEATETLISSKGEGEGDNSGDEEEPDMMVVLVFSVLCLIIDFMNLFCFAKVPNHICHDEPISIPNNFRVEVDDSFADQSEASPLLSNDRSRPRSQPTSLSESTFEEEGSWNDELSTQKINLNMCSAWTVSIQKMYKYCSVVALFICYNAIIHIHILITFSSVLYFAGIHVQHVLADTMRSIALIFAACLSYFTDLVSPAIADASAAIFISFIIFLSCIPLIKGLIKTLCELLQMRRERK